MASHVNVETNLKAAQTIDVLRSHPGEIMTSKSIANELSQRGMDILPKTVSTYLSVLIKQGDYPQLTSQPRVGFIWNADEAEFYAKKAETTENKSAYRKKNPVMRNAEGYSDTTAGKAIRNVEGDDPYARLGEVWSVKGANGLVEWFLILSDWGAVRIGLPLYAGDYRSRIRVKVDVAGTTLYGDATNLRSKPSKYFDTYMGNVEDKKARVILNDVLKAVCDPDISPMVIEAVATANTIEVDGVLYTETDVKNKIAWIKNHMEETEGLDNDIVDLTGQLDKANAKIKELEDANNGIRTALISAKKNKPIVVEVDGEIYNEEDIKAVIRDRNTVRVGNKVYRASDIIALEEGNYVAEDADNTFASDMTADMNYLIQQSAEYKIYKQFFDAYCTGLAKGDIE